MTEKNNPLTPEEKKKAHFAKAKKAILGLARDKGGSCPMAEMHAFSESRYFIAHQQFSRLLEDCVAEGLVEVEDFNVVLTDAGRAFAG